jgi:CTP:molybdopterin cytidylyltransferase MocA
VAVSGHRAAEVRAEASRLGIRCVHHPDIAQGMYGSARAGLAALPPDLEAVFLLPVDIPLVRPSTLRLLLERLERLPYGVVEVLAPWFRGEPGHPPLLCRGAVARVLETPDGQSLCSVLAGLPQERVDTIDAGILFDVDTDADYTRALQRWTRRAALEPAEALALLEMRGMGERDLAHARAVTRVALVLARALVRNGSRLNLPLLECAGLLHDICKKSPRHEAEGGRLLAELGFPKVGRIVAAHRDVDPERLVRLSELELVDCSLADVQLSAVLLQGARFTGCRFLRCRFAHADLREAAFEDCSFADAEAHVGAAFAFSRRSFFLASSSSSETTSITASPRYCPHSGQTWCGNTGAPQSGLVQ